VFNGVLLHCQEQADVRDSFAAERAGLEEDLEAAKRDAEQASSRAAELEGQRETLQRELTKAQQYADLLTRQLQATQFSAEQNVRAAVESKNAVERQLAQLSSNSTASIENAKRETAK